MSSNAGTPLYVDVDAVKKQLLSVRGVADLHNLHIWSLNTNHRLISVHVAAGAQTDAAKLNLFDDSNEVLPSQWKKPTRRSSSWTQHSCCAPNLGCLMSPSKWSEETSAEVFTVSASLYIFISEDYLTVRIKTRHLFSI